MASSCSVISSLTIAVFKSSPSSAVEHSSARDILSTSFKSVVLEYLSESSTTVKTRLTTDSILYLNSSLAST